MEGVEVWALAERRGEHVKRSKARVEVAVTMYPLDTVTYPPLQPNPPLSLPTAHQVSSEDMNWTS